MGMTTLWVCLDSDLLSIFSLLSTGFFISNFQTLAKLVSSTFCVFLMTDVTYQNCKY